MLWAVSSWQKLASEYQISNMEEVVEEITLHELDRQIDTMLNRGSKGRVIVNMQL